MPIMEDRRPPHWAVGVKPFPAHGRLPSSHAADAAIVSRGKSPPCFDAEGAGSIPAAGASANPRGTSAIMNRTSAAPNGVWPSREHGTGNRDRESLRDRSS
jgi:hypothetical protein